MFNLHDLLRRHRRRDSDKTRKTAVLSVVSILSVAFALLAFFSVQVISCDQDDIFAYISNEPPFKDPRIPGIITSIVIAKETVAGGTTEESYLYAAGRGSSRVFKYRDGKWDSFNTPEGRVVNLAGDGETLYILDGKNDAMEAKLYRKGPSDKNWTAIGVGEAKDYSLQSIFCAGEMLFVGGRLNKVIDDNLSQKYDVFCIDSGALKSISNEPLYDGSNDREKDFPELKGAAVLGSVYYIATGTGGAYSLDSGVKKEIPVKNPAQGATEPLKSNITGIIEIDNKIYAVTWDGLLLRLNAAGTEFEKIAQVESANFTGGMGIWQNYGEGNGKWDDKLLLLGVHTAGSYNKGYREIPLSDLSTLSADKLGTFDEPGRKALSSIREEDRYRYDTSLVVHTVNDIFQIPDEIESFPRVEGSGEFANPNEMEPIWEPVIFASTIKGLHSLRDGTWNAE